MVCLENHSARKRSILGRYSVGLECGLCITLLAAVHTVYTSQCVTINAVDQ